MEVPPTLHAVLGCTKTFPESHFHYTRKQSRSYFCDARVGRLPIEHWAQIIGVPVTDALLQTEQDCATPPVVLCLAVSNFVLKWRAHSRAVAVCKLGCPSAGSLSIGGRGGGGRPSFGVFEQQLSSCDEVCCRCDNILDLLLSATPTCYTVLGIELGASTADSARQERQCDPCCEIDSLSDLIVDALNVLGIRRHVL